MFEGWERLMEVNYTLLMALKEQVGPSRKAVIDRSEQYGGRTVRATQGEYEAVYDALADLVAGKENDDA